MYWIFRIIFSSFICNGLCIVLNIFSSFFKAPSSSPPAYELELRHFFSSFYLCYNLCIVEMILALNKKEGKFLNHKIFFLRPSVSLC